jgi:hypothetical protein
VKRDLRADGSLGEKLQPFLPRLTGPFGIGNRTFSVADSTRVDFATVATSQPRRLLAQVWYPAEASEALRLPPVLDLLVR